MINFRNVDAIYNKSDKIINVNYFGRNALLYKNTARWTRQ